MRGRRVRLLRGGIGRPLLFLHDTFCLTWLPVHDQLAARYEVFLPVHPGCAGSEDGFENFADVEDLVFHYLDLCQTLRLERPVLMGASLGGWIAAEWTVRYGSQLKSLILVDALGLRLPDAPAADILSLDPASAREIVFANPASALAEEILPDTPNPETLVATIKARQSLARFGWQFPDNPKLSRYLYRVRIPTLIIWGECDGVVPAAHARAYHEGIGNSELVMVPDSGHLPHVEQPETCAKAVLDFLHNRDP